MLFTTVNLLCTHSDSDLIFLLIRSWVIGVNFHHLHDNLKNTAAISSNIFAGTLGTLIQHEFALGSVTLLQN